MKPSEPPHSPSDRRKADGKDQRSELTSNDHMIDIVNSRSQITDLPHLNLDEYRMIVGQIPPPNKQQIEDFAAYVSEAKSWYKHLPLWQPGQPFHFFIDPWAGMDRLVDENCRAMYTHRTEETVRFHYTWMTTEDYWSRYGWLAFACAEGTQLFCPVQAQLQNGEKISRLLDNNPCRAILHLTEEHEFQLPQEVLDIGTVRVTGVIHRNASMPYIWMEPLHDNAYTMPWPEQTGGAETVAKILGLLRNIAKKVKRSPKSDNQGILGEVNQELDNYLVPERKRLQEEMIAAMRKMVNLIYGIAI